MTFQRSGYSGLPQGVLVQAIEIVRDKESGVPSLRYKLQRAFAKPFSSSLRKAAADQSRIGKLKAPDAMAGSDFMITPPTKSQ